MELAPNEYRRSVLAALSRVVHNPSPVVELLHDCPDEPTAKARLASELGMEGLQVDACLDMTLRRLIQSNRDRIEDELRSLEQ
jgi:DNA gyrase/topoisomerase IV subunit A